MSASPVLFETERLLARHLTEADYDAMYAVYSDPEGMRYVDDGSPIEPAECARWIEITRENYAKYGYGMSALVLKETGAVAGFMGLVHPRGQLDAEIKYAFSAEHWGRGLATEAARAMLAYGQESFGIEYVIATTDPDNKASHRVLIKAGLAWLETRLEDDGTPIEVFAWSAP